MLEIYLFICYNFGTNVKEIKSEEIMNISPLTVFEFNGTTIRVCRSVVKKTTRLITHCFAFEVEDIEKDAPKFLERELKTQSLKPDNCILSLPRYAAMSRFLRLPSQDQEEIGDMVSLYVRQQGVYDKDSSMVFDYKLAGFDAQGYALVSAFYIQYNRLKKYLDVLSKIGIYPFKVTLNTQGLLNWFITESDKKNNRCLFFINIDHAMAEFNVFLNGYCISSRILTIPKPGGCDRSVWLTKEVKISLELFKRTCEGNFEYDNKLYLTGLTEDWENQDLEELMEWQISHFAPAQYLKIRPRAKKNIQNAAVSFSSILGLALGKDRDPIDMMPLDLRQRNREKRKWSVLWKTTAVVAIVINLATIFLFGLLNRKIERLGVLKAELRGLGPVENTIKQAQELFYFETKILERPSVFEILGAFYDMTPSTVDIADLSIKEDGSMMWTGESGEATFFFEYWKTLRQSVFFTKCHLDYMEDLQGKGGSGRVKFRITCSRH